jgi:hypothetical protein
MIPGAAWRRERPCPLRLVERCAIRGPRWPVLQKSRRRRILGASNGSSQEARMKRQRLTRWAGWLAVAAIVAGGAAALAAERQMNVRQGPETVFDRPVEQLIPQLQGARATNQNGRVGGELVFWGYQLADGGSAYLFACAPIGSVNCEERISAICPVFTEVMTRSEYAGQVIRRNCREVCVSAPGDLRPCCTDTAAQSPLQIGLVSCR